MMLKEKALFILKTKRNLLVKYGENTLWLDVTETAMYSYRCAIMS